MQQALRKFKVAIIQNRVALEKVQTLQYVREFLDEAGRNGAQVSVLGETFNCIYGKDFLVKSAENFSLANTDPDKTPTLQLLKEMAAKYQMYIFGSIPEATDQNQLFNTAVAIDKQGNLLAKFRKMHLFDINIPGKITYKESDTFTAGDEVVVVDTEFCKVGLGVCYDLRFPELSLLMAKKGAELMIFPGAFNLTTGPLHYELLLRSRALDNLSFVIGSCVARYTEDPSLYQAWGHSSLIDPFGRVLTSAEEKPVVLYHDVDLDIVQQVRSQIPIYNQKRTDVYDLKYLKE